MAPSNDDPTIARLISAEVEITCPTCGMESVAAFGEPHLQRHFKGVCGAAVGECPRCGKRLRIELDAWASVRPKLAQIIPLRELRKSTDS